MRRPDNNHERRSDSSHHQRRPSCSWRHADAYIGRDFEGTASAPSACSWPAIIMDRLLDFADELSEDTLGELSVIADDYCFIAVLADIVDASGNVSAKLVLVEPRFPNDDDALGLIVLPPGAQPGDGILFTRPRT
jgi:hypothetical protein